MKTSTIIVQVILYIFISSNCFSQVVNYKIDSLTKEISYKQTFTTNQTDIKTTISKWISSRFNVPEYKIKFKNNTSEFINTIPVYKGNIGQESIIGECNYTVKIVFDSTKFSISIQDITYINDEYKDSLHLEAMVLSKDEKVLKIYHVILNQIDLHAMSLISDVGDFVVKNIRYKKSIVSRWSLNRLDYSVSPGTELIKATHHMYLGISLTMGGAILGLWGSYELSFEIKHSMASTMQVLGAFSMITGMLVTIESFSHVKNAGILLNNLSSNNQTSLYLGLTNNGIGLAYKF